MYEQGGQKEGGPEGKEGNLWIPFLHRCASEFCQALSKLVCSPKDAFSCVPNHMWCLQGALSHRPGWHEVLRREVLLQYCNSILNSAPLPCCQWVPIVQPV